MIVIRQKNYAIPAIVATAGKVALDAAPWMLSGKVSEMGQAKQMKAQEEAQRLEARRAERKAAEMQKKEQAAQEKAMKQQVKIAKSQELAAKIQSMPSAMG